MKRERVHVFYSGRVQGVGFRFTVKMVAHGFDVTGTVRNVDDERVFGGAIFVMVALYAGHAHVPDDVEAFLGVCVVAHHVSNAAIMRAFLVPCVL